MIAPDLLDDEECLIRIEGLQLMASIGIYAHELAARQSLLVDLSMTVCATAAAASDDIRYTVDYDHVVARLEALVEHRHFNLLETLSKAMLRTLVDNFPIGKLSLTLNKPAAVPKARMVSVSRSFDRNRQPARLQLASVS